VRCPVDLNFDQSLPSEVDPTVGRFAQQCFSLDRFARAAFAIKQHHCEVVLTERMSVFRSSTEVMTRFNVIADQPRGPSLHQMWIRGSVPHLGFSADSAHARKE
jgi:hypothetical protein